MEEASAGDDWWWRFVLVVRDDAGLSWGWEGELKEEVETSDGVERWLRIEQEV